MDLSLSDEHEMVQKMVRDFSAREIAPTVKELDRQQIFDRTIMPKMAEQGILGICLPVRYGGAGMDYVSLGLACEELEYVDTAYRVILSVHVALNSLTLLQWANEEQKERYLVPQALGEKVGTYGLTEPSAGSDVVGIQSTARPEGDHWLLNGEKMWISLADVADHMIVFAWTDTEKKRARDHRGLSAFIVERGFEGLITGSIHGKLGVRAGNTGWISMKDVPVPAANMLGNEGEGFYIAMSALDNGRYTVAWGATGLIRACLDASVRYARERQTFGVEIGQHELVQQMIAQMQLKYDAAQLLCMRAGWLKNRGQRNTRETGLAKWYATVSSFEAAADAVQVHGAYGYSDEYDVERFLRNAKGAVIYEGSAEIQQLLQAQYALGYRKDRALRRELPAYEPDSWQEG